MCKCIELYCTMLYCNIATYCYNVTALSGTAAEASEESKTAYIYTGFAYFLVQIK